MNLIAIIGNLASEPELRTTSGGRKVCNFRVAVSRPGGEHADFFTVVAWEKQAQICAEWLHKGRRVAVEGRLHHSVWEVQEGEVTSKRGRVEIVASRVDMLGGPRTQEEAVASTEADASTDTVFASTSEYSFANAASGSSPVLEEAGVMAETALASAPF